VYVFCMYQPVVQRSILKGVAGFALLGIRAMYCNSDVLDL